MIELQLNHNSNIFELFPKEVNQTSRKYRQNDTMTIKKSPDNVSQQNIKPLKTTFGGPLLCVPLFNKELRIL